MKRLLLLWVCLVFWGMIPAPPLPAEESPPWLWLGPRIGLTGVIATASDFDAVIQELYPKPERYFPLYSELGASAEQVIRIGTSKHSLFVQERLLVGGLDQAAALPSLSLLLGFRSAGGFQSGLGPDLSLESGGGKALAPAMVYALGWCFFAASGVKIPVVLSAVPIPPEGNPRLSLLTGLDFGLDLQREERQPPFNY